ncbi:hypothetical protein [Streptomyces sp. NPDC051738]|uniref:hypothetical protein n=1 Tax=Streptomyces sp. NPDC051738 TaxID=3365672 RepID=UPI0037CF1ADA
MSDDAGTGKGPGAPETPAASGGSAVRGGGNVAEGGSGDSVEGPKVSLGKGDERASTSLDKPRVAGLSDAVPGHGGAVPGGFQTPPERDPWAPPVEGARAAGCSPSAGRPGHTLASNEPPTWPAPSVHDRETVGAVPPMDVPSEPRDAVPPASPWMNPSVEAGSATPPGGSAANPFAPPGATAPMPSAPVNPFAPPAGAGGPYAAHGEAVPPPPIAPDGPGRVPYGYPGGHGYPHLPGPGPGPAGYYGWPGMHPMPSNGMGTAGLVLGIISAVIFCLWPVAIVVGVLAVIFGGIGMGKARRGEATNRGQALAGVICGAAGLVLSFVMLAFVISTA